jgi:hypothetical protein
MLSLFLLLLGLSCYGNAAIRSEQMPCTTNGDCTEFNTFCGGPFICNTTHQCQPATKNYNACATLDNALVAFFQTMGRPSGKLPIVISCVEHLAICIESFVCNSDSDCNNGLRCDGEEKCVGGGCILQKDQSMKAICGSPDATCTESKGCVTAQDGWGPPEDDDDDDDHHHHHHHPNNSGSIITVAVLISVFGAITLAIILYLIFRHRRPAEESPMATGGGGTELVSTKLNSKKTNFNRSYKTK